MPTQRILDFLARQRPDEPCLVVDLDIVQENYHTFERVLPSFQIYYAVKANPAPEILTLLVRLGSSFDTASVAEIGMAMEAGASVSRISFGNTIKKERDIVQAYALGIRLFAVDSIEEVEKIARAAPGSRVFCRILTDGAGAEGPLSRKFGCTTVMAVNVLRQAQALGLNAYGVSFHFGSQLCDIAAAERALCDVKQVFEALAAEAISLRMVNIGGGFPTRYLKSLSDTESYGKAIGSAFRKHFGNKLPETVIEPGRGMVANAGFIRSEVVLISKKAADDDTRWVYLDIGKFGGLAETADEAIRYPIVTARDGGEVAPCVLAGPTCDSADVLYEKQPYPLPLGLAIGDKIFIEETGAYTATYSAVAFNGFAPLRSYVI